MYFCVSIYKYYRLIKQKNKNPKKLQLWGRQPKWRQILLLYNILSLNDCFFSNAVPLGLKTFLATSLQMTYRQCLCDPVKVSITKHSPSLRQYARSLSLHGLKCSDRSVEYVVVSMEKTEKGKKCCKAKYWMLL